MRNLQNIKDQINLLENKYIKLRYYINYNDRTGAIKELERIEEITEQINTYLNQEAIKRD